MPLTKKYLTDKILVKQYGAVKPPWISKDVFYKLPFNFCDRWCERCYLKKICRVYIKENERRHKFIQEGVDPDSMEATFKTISESFTEVRQMLEKEIKKLKITKKDLEETENAEKLTRADAQRDELHKTSSKISLNLTKLFEDIEYSLAEVPQFRVKVEEHIKILAFYMHFFSAKIYRAIMSCLEKDADDTTFDDKTSAFLAGTALKKITIALDYLARFDRMPIKIRSQAKKQALICDELVEILNKRFEIDKLYETGK